MLKFPRFLRVYLYLKTLSVVSCSVILSKCCDVDTTFVLKDMQTWGMTRLIFLLLVSEHHIVAVTLGIDRLKDLESIFQLKLFYDAVKDDSLSSSSD